MLPRLKVASGLGVVVLLAACGGSDVGLAPIGDPVPTTIELTPGQLTFTSLGETSSIQAAVLDQAGGPLVSASLSWLSSDTLVATVSVDGIVTAIGNGVALVEVVSGTASAGATVTVAQVPDTVHVTPDPVTLSGPADTLRVTGVVQDAGGSEIVGQTVIWGSADEGIATVDADGLVTAVAEGSTALSATSGGLSTTVPVSVTVTPAEITASPATVGFESLGDTARVATVVRDAAGNEILGAGVVWTSNDASVVTVQDGLLTAIGVGSTTIVATSGPVSDTVTVTVIQVPSAVVAFPTAVALNGPGDTVTIEATVVDAGGSPVPGELVSFSSTDEGVATVSPSGLITATAQGSTTIVAQSGVLSTTIDVTVTQTPASIELTPDSLWFGNVGDTATVLATVRDANGNQIPNASVSWASSDTTVATVSDNGLVTALEFGTATVTASAGAALASLAVVVEQAQPAPSFSQEVNPIFVARGCTTGNCHGGGSGDLTLSATAATSYANLVNVAAKGEPTLLLVKPNDAENSYLVIKLEGRQSSGARMPIGGASLSASEIQTIRAWIDLGAPNN